MCISDSVVKEDIFEKLDLCIEKVRAFEDELKHRLVEM